MTDTGMRRALKTLSEITPAMNTLNGPASSNIALRKPDAAIPVPNLSFTYFGPQNRIA
jgi:hypothetical protein